MALSGTPYNGGKENLLNATADLSAAGTNLRVALFTSAYTPNVDDLHLSDIQANEVSGTGYVAGGILVANKSVVRDDVNDRAELDFDDPVWSGITVTFRTAVLYHDTGAAATSRLLCWWSDGADHSPAGGDLTLKINTEGAYQVA